MNSHLVIGLILASTLSISALAEAKSSPTPPPSSSSGGGDFHQKAQKKESTRWTLQEWLEQKQRNQMMDQWLVMNAPSPYEFFIKGSYLSYSSKAEIASVASPETSHFSYQGAIGAYANMIGLEGDYENNSQEAYNDLAGSLNLRLFGTAVQGTHLNLRYGLRTREIAVSGVTQRLVNQFAGAELNLYLTRHFGLSGLYNKYLPSEEALYGTVSGNRTEGGLFIDFEAFRIFGNWFSDRQETEKAGVKSSLERVGIQSGFRFFF